MSWVRSVLTPLTYISLLAPVKTPRHQATESKTVPAFDVIVRPELLAKHRQSIRQPDGRVIPIPYSRCCTTSGTSVGIWLFYRKGKWSKWAQSL